MTPRQTSEAELFARLRGLLGKWHDIPQGRGYGGTGAPGKLLESLLGIDGGNEDLPDSGKWELKFHSGNALLTLFHKEASPTGHMHNMVRKFGQPDAHGRISFRHTIRGSSNLGFTIASDGGQIIIRNPHTGDIALPYWTHDELVTAFAAKFRRLIAVQGKKKHGRVFYKQAVIYQEPLPSAFIAGIVSGMVAIDFDARTDNEVNTRNRGLRNHGTKFRIAPENLHRLYAKRDEF